MATDPDARTWLYHPPTGNHFNCPAGAVEHWKALGWQVADQPPEELNPAVAELVAWREAQAAEQAAAEQAAQETTDQPAAEGAPATTTGRPRRGATTTNEE